MRVLSEDGTQLGILSRAEALAAAREAELDLVEISPDAKPSVAKIVDWGKFNYQRTKQIQKNKRASKVVELKQIRYGLKIGDHDISIKGKKVVEFLQEGHKVRLTVVFRGRELSHKELGYKLLEKILGLLGDEAITDHPPILAGKQLSTVVRSNNAKAKNA
jgi:translation initiation factor IF-3